MIALCLAAVGCAPRNEHIADPKALGPYSGVVIAGDLIFVSGKIGDPKAAFPDQAAQAIGAVSLALESAGSSWSDAVSATVYLADMALFPEFNETYARLVPRPYPARAVAAVSGLPGGAKVEIQVVSRKR